MMMSKTATIPLMMALRMAPIPLTTAIKAAPMARNTEVICGLVSHGYCPKQSEKTYARYDGTHCVYVYVCDVFCVCRKYELGE
jgi:hypothetical protein